MNKTYTANLEAADYRFKQWENRHYLNNKTYGKGVEEILGYLIGYYKSGNISGAEKWDSEEECYVGISNSQARKEIVNLKIYVENGEVHAVSGDYIRKPFALSEEARAFIAEIAKMEELEIN